MVVKGEHQFDVSAQQLWNYLMDIDVLAKITPGVSKLEVIEVDKYRTVSEIKIGPVKGSFKGKLEVVDKIEPDSFAIVMDQLSKIGNAHVKVDMQIKNNGAEASALNFDGKAKLSGVIARTGQRVLSGVANTITKEVFASLEEHITEDQKANPSSALSDAPSLESVVQDKEGMSAVAKESSNVAENTDVNVAKDIDTSLKLEAENTVVNKDTEATTTVIEKAKELATNQESKLKEVVADVTGNMKSEVIDNVVNASDKTSGFFAGIISFFKRLFS